uniref:Uncharacterized protein n=1 Tax=viral metagenome TaxID=1070528 RepID=A0A6C0D6J9_9ZZZZ
MQTSSGTSLGNFVGHGQSKTIYYLHKIYSLYNVF